MTAVQIDDLCMTFSDRGQGHPVLLVHGFPLDQHMWKAQCDALALDFRMIAPDLRGFGGSDGTENVLTMEQFADDLAVLLDRLKIEEPVTFCGLSMGGYVALQFLRKYPSRVHALILCDTRSAADTTQTAEGRYRLAEQVMREGSQAAAEAMIPKLVSKTTHTERPEAVRAVQEMILSTRPESIAAALRGMAIRPDMTGMLPEIDVPVLMIVGEEDQITPPEEMRQMADHIDSCRVVVVAGAGHLPPMEQPRAVTRSLLRFLSVRA